MTSDLLVNPLKALEQPFKTHDVAAPCERLGADRSGRSSSPDEQLSKRLSIISYHLIMFDLYVLAPKNKLKP